MKLITLKDTTTNNMYKLGFIFIILDTFLQVDAKKDLVLLYQSFLYWSFKIGPIRGGIKYDRKKVEKNC